MSEPTASRAMLRRAAALAAIMASNALAGFIMTIPISVALFWLDNTAFGDAGYEYARDPGFFRGLGVAALSVCVFFFVAVNAGLHLLRFRQTAVSALVAPVAFGAPYVAQSPYLWS